MSFKGNELNIILEYSDDMLKAAEAGLWENVISLEKKRNSTLQELFSVPFTKEEKFENREKLSAILAVNEKLEKATAQARGTIKEEVCNISKGRHAVKMYHQNTG